MLVTVKLIFFAPWLTLFNLSELFCFFVNFKIIAESRAMEKRTPTISNYEPSKNVRKNGISIVYRVSSTVWVLAHAVCISPHCDFQRLILQTIKKYSLLVELNAKRK